MFVALLLMAPVAGAVAGSPTRAAAGPAVEQVAPEQSGPEPASTGDLTLELIDEEFAFGPNGTLRLRYRLVGDPTTIAELRPVEPSDATAVDATAVDATAVDATGADGTGDAPSSTAPDPSVPDAPPDPAIDPETGEPLPDPVRLTILIANYPRLERSNQVEQFVGGDVAPDDFQDAIDGIVIADVRAAATFHDDETVTIALDVPTDVVDSQPERLKFEAPGLYPLRVQLLIGPPDDPDTVLTHGTVVQRLAGRDDPRAAEPIDLTLVAGVPDPGPLSLRDERALATDRLDDIAATSAELESPFTLSLPPTTVESATGSPGARDRLSDQLSGDELVALPAVPFDVSSAVAADVLPAYALELREGEDMLTRSLPTIPSRRDVWLAVDPLSAGGAQALRDLGTRMIVMTPDVYVRSVDADLPAIDQFVEIALPDGGSLPLLVVDPLGIQFTPDGTAAMLRRYTGSEWAVATVAGMLLDQATGSITVQRSRALATPDLSAPDPRLLSALEQLAATTPAVRFAQASTLTGLTDVQRSAGEPLRVDLPDDAGPPLADRVSLLNGTRLVAANAASMLAPDDPRPVDWNARLDTLVASGYPESYVEADAAAMRAEAEALLGAVVAPEPFTFTLTGKSGDIDMRIGNLSDETLNVKLHMSSPKLTFPDGDQIVALAPRSETSVIVPVRARANGTSLVTVEILTPVDQPITEPVMVTSRVNALTGLGQVLTGGFVIVLLTWWFAHWRARRRSSPPEDGVDPHDDEADDAIDDATDHAGGTPSVAPAFGAPVGEVPAGLPPPGE